MEVHDDGRILVDEYQRTSAEGVFALGDVCTPVPLKHVANHEAQVVPHNLRHPGSWQGGPRPRTGRGVHPAADRLGRATEQEPARGGADYRVGLARYSDAGYGWAMEDASGFCKVLVEPGTGTMLGAHLLGPQAASLIQPLVLGRRSASTPGRCHGPYWIHPALTEVVQQALIAAL